MGLDPRWQLHPRMATAVVHRILRRREARVGECSDRHSDPRLPKALLGVEHGSSADRAEPEPEPRSMISGADTFGGCTEGLERRDETGQCGEDASGPPLTGQTVTDANALRLTFDFNAQLAA